MKNFLSKYWKRILITITGIFIFLNILRKTITPHILVSEYAKYGVDVKPSSLASRTAEQVASNVRETTAAVPESLFKIVLILGIGIIVAVILTDLANKKPAPAKKK